MKAPTKKVKTYPSGFLSFNCSSLCGSWSFALIESKDFKLKKSMHYNFFPPTNSIGTTISLRHTKSYFDSVFSCRDILTTLQVARALVVCLRYNHEKPNSQSRELGQLLFYD